MIIVDKASAVAHADLVNLHGVTRTKVEMETEEILIINSINHSKHLNSMTASLWGVV